MTQPNVPPPLPPNWPEHMEFSPDPNPPPASIPTSERKPLWGFQLPDGNWYLYRYDVVLSPSTKTATYQITDNSNYDFDKAIAGQAPDNQIIVNGWLILNKHRMPLDQIILISKTIVPVDVDRAKTT